MHPSAALAARLIAPPVNALVRAVAAHSFLDLIGVELGQATIGRTPFAG